MATTSSAAPVVEVPKTSAPDEATNNVTTAVGASKPAAVNVASTETVAGEQSTKESDGKRQAGKGDKKTRRDRPPLPDEIPTTPVKRYPEPSRAEVQAKVDERDTIVKECFDKLAASRNFFDQRTKVREAGRGELEAARKKLNSKNDECRILFEKRKSLTLRIKQLREADFSARNVSSSSRAGKEEAALKGLKTVQEVDERIAELEFEHQTVSLSMQEEKKLINRISFLRHTGRDMVQAKDSQFKEEAAAKKSRGEQRQVLEAERKDIDTKIDEAKAILNGFKKEVDAIRAKQDTEIKKLAEKTADIDRDAIRTQISVEKANIRRIREDFQKELDDWYLNERIHYEQQKIAKKKKWEAQQAEREARRKAWEEEQAQYPEPDPFQKEKDMCAGLIAFLKTLLGETTEKTTTKNLLSKSGAPTLKATDGGNSRSISSSGKAIGKGKKSDEFEALAFSDFMSKRKPKGKKGKRMSAAAAPKIPSGDDGDAPLKPCSIDLLAAFTHLEIAPPTKFSEVRAALGAVRAKQDYYDSDPAPKPAETPKQSGAKPKQEKKANGNPKAPADSSSTTAFPGLRAENTDAKSADIAASGGSVRPSFKDIAKGSAVAPSMGASAFPEGMVAEDSGAPSMGADAFPDALMPEVEKGGDVDVNMSGDSGLSHGNKHDSTVAPQDIAFNES